MDSTATSIESKPAVKEIKPINFLYFRTETTLQELVNFIPVAKDLVKEAASLNLHVTGACHWHYFGFTGDASTPFTLEVALPVASIVPDYDGNFHFKRTESFKCVTLTHEGGWDTIPGAYETLMAFIDEHNMEASGVTREIYVNVDFQDPTANVTWIQTGIR